MGRRPRVQSETGIYHVILKGLDGRSLFYNGEDRDVFMDKLRRAQEIGGLEVYAYCLMDNHVHLLVKEGEELGDQYKTAHGGICAAFTIKNMDESGICFRTVITVRSWRMIVTCWQSPATFIETLSKPI